ncbi:MAG: hypothetical protein IJ051_07800 [Clostridia bacterium]|nr:hypothetical protein [Clostridia bacterium]
MLETIFQAGPSDYVVGNFMYDPVTASPPGAFNDFLTIVGGLFWMACYIMVILRGRKDKTLAMPLMVLGLNFAWEFCYAFVFQYQHLPQRIVNVFWFLIDCGLVFYKFKFAKDDFRHTFPGANEKWAYPYVTAIMIAGFVVLYYSYYDFGDALGVYSAFIQNTFISTMFLTSFYRRGRDIAGTSMGIAICKQLGTLAPIICGVVQMLWQGGAANLAGMMVSIQVMCVVIVVTDCLYTYAVYKRMKELGLNPWTRKPLAEK